MVVAATVGINLSLFEGGNLDPRMPAGRWWASGVVSGDASGGSATISVEIFPASAPPNTFAFELEHLAVHWSGTTTAQDIEVIILGMTPGLGGPESERYFALDGLSLPGAATVSTLPANVRPYLLGYRVDGARGRVVVVGSNTNSAAMRVDCQGQFWLENAGSYIGAQQPPESQLFNTTRPPEAQGAYIDIRAGRPSPQSPSVTAIKAPGGAVGAPVALVPPRQSPAASQDPLAAMRAAFAASLFSNYGMSVATIPGDTGDEVRSNFQALVAVATERKATALVPPVRPPAAAPAEARSRGGGAKSKSIAKPPTGGLARGTTSTIRSVTATERAIQSQRNINFAQSVGVGAGKPTVAPLVRVTTPRRILSPGIATPVVPATRAARIREQRNRNFARGFF